MPEAVIVAAARTPIGRAFKGSFADVRARRPRRASSPARRSDQVPAVADADVVDVIWGAANMVGPQGFNMARNIALLAGLPDSVPGTTVNRFCASSLQAIRMAFHAIKAGEGDTYVAGGVESVSQRPASYDARGQDPRFVDTSRSDYLADATSPWVSPPRTWPSSTRHPRAPGRVRRASQNRAEKAIATGSSTARSRRSPRPTGPSSPRTTAPAPAPRSRRSPALKPAFLDDGTVTAGNSCPLNDGAAAVVVMSADKARALGLTPLARIVATAVIGPGSRDHGRRPDRGRPQGPGRRPGMTIGDIDVVELNEAFAAQVLPVCDNTGIDIERPAQPARRRHRPRAPVRHDRRPHHDHAAQRPADARPDLRPRDDVRRRRPGHGHDRRAPLVGERWRSTTSGSARHVAEAPSEGRAGAVPGRHAGRPATGVTGARHHVHRRRPQRAEPGDVPRAPRVHGGRRRDRPAPALPVRPEHLAPNGFLHAAVVVAAADTACGYGCRSLLPEGSTGFTTIELKSNFLGTALDGALVVDARAVHAGRTTQVWDADVRAVAAGGEVPDARGRPRRSRDRRVPLHADGPLAAYLTSGSRRGGLPTLGGAGDRAAAPCCRRPPTTSAAW